MQERNKIKMKYQREITCKIIIFRIKKERRSDAERKNKQKSDYQIPIKMRHDRREQKRD